jgi:hypothetical protein
MTSDDLSQLREQYPGWRFGSVWASAASGPDKRRLTASRDGILVTAWTAPELREKLGYEERQARQQ